VVHKPDDVQRVPGGVIRAEHRELKINGQRSRPYLGMSRELKFDGQRSRPCLRMTRDLKFDGQRLRSSSQWRQLRHRLARENASEK
jgi:hypothetical protein